jgi:SPW repeat
MFRQGPIPAFVHGVLEYALGALLVAAPWLFSFSSSSAKAVSIVAGVLVLMFAASSALSTGLIKSIPVQAHVVLDYILGGLLIASPFIFSFSDDGTATPFFIVTGIVYLLVTIATRFIREPKRPRRERAADAKPAQPQPPSSSSR